MDTKQKEYVCQCGRVFYNSQAFNGHRSHCKEHLGEERYQESVKRERLAQAKAADKNRSKSAQLKQDRMEQWISEQHRCEKCGKIMTEKFGSGRFCSSSCAHSRTHTDESRIKTAKSVKQFYTNSDDGFDFDQYVDGTMELYLSGVVTHKTLRYYLLDKIEGVDFVICPYCGVRLSQIQCGHLKIHGKTLEDLKREFGNDYQTVSNVTHKKKSQSSQQVQNRLIKDGNHIGWQSRKVRSYAELFWERVLNNNKLKYKSECVVKKKDLGVEEKGCYFLDFVIDGFIDLEIDGKQHQYDNRKQHDTQRDELLTKNGFIVYRIPWINPVHSEKVQQQINDFIKWYENLSMNSNIS